MDDGVGQCFKSPMFFCPDCGAGLPVVPTAYGHRAVCQRDGKRWTVINGDKEWVEEAYSPMAENVRGDGET